MKLQAIFSLILLMFMAGVFAQDLIGNTPNNTNSTFQSVTTIDNPWAADSRICGFVHTYIFIPVVLIIFIIFLAGVATISGAAFPRWRNYGSQMILGSIGASILYILGTSALHSLLGISVCGL